MGIICQNNERLLLLLDSSRYIFISDKIYIVSGNNKVVVDNDEIVVDGNTVIEGNLNVKGTLSVDGDFDLSNTDVIAKSIQTNTIMPRSINGVVDFKVKDSNGVVKTVVKIKKPQLYSSGTSAVSLIVANGLKHKVDTDSL